MEYVITTERPFHEIEAVATAALERQGFVIQRTFSLHSATAASSLNASPGFSVFLLYWNDARLQPVGSVTLYQRGRWTVISPQLTSPADGDMDADLLAALMLGGLEFCLGLGGDEQARHA
jgi:hypothetical protein